MTTKQINALEKRVDSLHAKINSDEFMRLLISPETPAADRTEINRTFDELLELHREYRKLLRAERTINDAAFVDLISKFEEASEKLDDANSRQENIAKQIKTAAQVASLIETIVLTIASLAH